MQRQQKTLNHNTYINKFVVRIMQSYSLLAQRIQTPNNQHQPAH